MYRIIGAKVFLFLIKGLMGILFITLFHVVHASDGCQLPGTRTEETSRYRTWFSGNVLRSCSLVSHFSTNDMDIGAKSATRIDPQVQLTTCRHSAYTLYYNNVWETLSWHGSMDSSSALPSWVCLCTCHVSLPAQRFGDRTGSEAADGSCRVIVNKAFFFFF